MPGIPPIDAYPIPGVGDLPRSTAQWKLDPARAVLLIHDMQRFFLAPFPAAVRDKITKNIALLRDRCAGLGIPVAYTAQPGDMDDEERGLLKAFWGPGMHRTPAEQRVVDDLAPAPGDWMFKKLRYSAFFGSDLLDRLRKNGRDQLIICGVYAHVGVLITAVEAFSNDIETFLVADAIADFTADHHRMALEYAAGNCAVLVTAEEALP